MRRQQGIDRIYLSQNSQTEFRNYRLRSVTLNSLLVALSGLITTYVAHHESIIVTALCCVGL